MRNRLVQLSGYPSIPEGHDESYINVDCVHEMWTERKIDIFGKSYWSYRIRMQGSGPRLISEKDWKEIKRVLST